MIKNLLAVCTFVAMGAVAQASSISVICSPNPASYLGQSGGGTETCLATQIPVNEVVSSITAQYIFDYQYDGFGPLGSTNSTSASFTFDATGTSGDWSATATQTGVNGRPLTSPVFQIAPSEWNAWLAGPTVFDTYNGSVDVTGATFTKRITVNTVSSVPEPSSYALMGFGLLALSYFRRRRA